MLLKGYEKYSTSSTFKFSLEEAVEKLADLLIGTSEQQNITPVQLLLLEEVAKISGAGARSFWTQLRQQSGKLPNGRTLLGSVIDPLGLFKGSRIADVDDYDTKTLEATSSLVNVINQNLKNANIDVGGVTPQQANKIIQLLSQKLWQRRFQLVNLGGNFLSVFLKQTADRLERGNVASSNISPINTDKKAIPLTTLVSNDDETDRLKLARKLLSSVEN